MSAALLETIDRERMLRNVHRILHYKLARRDVKLWVFVEEVCGVDPNVSMEICRELGWNPRALIGAELPARRRPTEPKRCESCYQIIQPRGCQSTGCPYAPH